MSFQRLWSIYTFLGSLAYLLAAFILAPTLAGERYGTLIYNYYFLSLINGRLDVPLQIIGWEAHLAPDGTAFVYHGLAPLVTRAFLYPFVDLSTATWVSTFTVWLFSAAGTAAWCWLFLRVLSRSTPPNEAKRRVLAHCVAFMVWALGPGIMLAVNDTLYHEPIAVGYFLTALFAAMIIDQVHEGKGMRLIPLAVIAGVTVYARPNIALFLYAVMIAFAVYEIMRGRPEAIRRSIAMLAILCAFGMGILGFNHMRFGDATKMHGTFHPSELQMGVTAFNLIPEDAVLTQVERHGHFNVWRVPTSLLLNMFDAPSDIIEAPDGSRVTVPLLRELHERSPERRETVAVEGPPVGFFWFWMPFLLLATIGIKQVGQQPVHVQLATAAMLALFVLICSYFAVTLRYRVELWPLIALLAAAGLPALTKLFDLTKRSGRLVGMVFATTLAFSVTMMAMQTYYYSSSFEQDGRFGVWSKEVCRDLVSASGRFGPNAAIRLCTLEIEGIAPPVL